MLGRPIGIFVCGDDKEYLRAPVGAISELWPVGNRNGISIVFLNLSLVLLVYAYHNLPYCGTEGCGLYHFSKLTVRERRE